MTDEEREALRAKMAAKQQSEQLESQLPSAYVEPKDSIFWIWLRKNIFWILSIVIGSVLALIFIYAAIDNGFIIPTHNFEKIYEKTNWTDEVYADIGDDGSYMFIDTNPFDLEEYPYSSMAGLEIKDINELLGIPESVFARMEQTRALDGVQTYEGSWFTVSWTYHPDNGLEIMYEKK